MGSLVWTGKRGSWSDPFTVVFERGGRIRGYLRACRCTTAPVTGGAELWGDDNLDLECDALSRLSAPTHTSG